MLFIFIAKIFFSTRKVTIFNQLGKYFLKISILFKFSIRFSPKYWEIFWFLDISS